MPTVNGTSGRDFIHRTGDGRVVPANFNDIPGATTGADTITGGLGDDIIFGDAGDDTAVFNPATDGADQTDLGAGMDTVSVADTGGEVRLTFTSSEVGNGNANDSNTMPPNQDGGLAVRFQAEDGAGGLTGPVSRFDDEGITFVAAGTTTFDVRDLVSGAQRGNSFRTVTLGTNGSDALMGTAQADYINAGQGDDTIFGGVGNDFLVGGAGNDTLNGGADNDSFIGGGGNDTILGGAGLADLGSDTVTFNVTTDGSDTIDLGGGSDFVTVNATTATNVRLTFTSAEVGNGNVNDSGTMANQDSGLAVRLQAESNGVPAGATTRVDDEGITFVGGAGVTFDVRDLVSGAARGELFEVVVLGTSESETLVAFEARPYYINAGAGDDIVYGASANDFLVGGSGNDTLAGAGGNDSFIGGGGDDIINGGLGVDTMTGGLDNDTYIVDNAADVIVEAAGQGTNDRVATSVTYTLRAGVEVEQLLTNYTAGTTALFLTGNEFAQAIAGNAGANRLYSAGGNDTLTGGGGNDRFYFTTALDASNNVDTITDFSATASGNNDSIYLSRTVFAALTGASGAVLSGDQFAANSTGTASNQFQHILYNTSTGALFYDADGNGTGSSAIQFAQLGTTASHPTNVTSADFFLV